MATNTHKKSRQPKPKPDWKDALAAIAAKEEQHQRFARRWGRLYRQARADVQSEEAVVFLGEDARRILGLDAPTEIAAAAPAVRRPGKATAALGGSAALVALAGYAVSLWRVTRAM